MCKVSDTNIIIDVTGFGSFMDYSFVRDLFVLIFIYSLLSINIIVSMCFFLQSAPVIIDPDRNGTHIEGKLPPGGNHNCKTQIPKGGATFKVGRLQFSIHSSHIILYSRKIHNFACAKQLTYWNRLTLEEQILP